MRQIEPNDSQRRILPAVANDGHVESHPENLQGDARASIMRGLLRNGRAEPHDAGYRLTGADWTAAATMAAT